MTRQVKTRKPELSALNVLFCLLVIFIHVTADPITQLDKSSWQYAVLFFPWRLSGFVMQGFVFLSALKLFINSESEFNYKKFYIKRFINIVLPYLIWCVIYYVYFIRHGYFSFSWTSFVKYIITGRLVSPFYFIITIVQFYAFIPLWRKMVKRVNPVFLLPLAAAATLFFNQHLPQVLTLINPGIVFKYNDRVFTTYLFYWMAGCYAGANYSRFKKLLRENQRFISVAFVICACLNAAFNYVAYSSEKYLPWLETLHFCYCICAIFLLFSVSVRIFKESVALPKLVRSVDKVSYSVFLSHCLVLFIVNDWMYKHEINRISATYSIRTAVVFIVTIASCIAWRWLITKIPTKRTRDT